MNEGGGQVADRPIRLLISSHGASLFGAERVLLALARGFRDRGHEVVLEIPHDGPAVAAANSIGEVGVWVSGRPRLPRNAREFIVYLLGIPYATWTLVRGIRRERPEVVWVNSLFNPLAAIAARLAGARVVWHLHERNLPGAAGRIYSRIIGRFSDLAVVVSEFVAATFDLPEDQMVVVPNALLTEIVPTQLRRRGRSFVVGYVGQLEPRKRVADILEAVDRLPETTAVIVGDGKGRGQVESKVERLDLESRVNLAGFQPDVRPYYERFDCVVISSSNEPFGLVALEAMAAGRPVIAARSGALPEVLGDAALYYRLGDVDELSAQLARIQSDPRLAASLREKGLKRVKLYSYERLIDRTEEIARAVRGSRNGAMAEGDGIHAAAAER